MFYNGYFRILDDISLSFTNFFEFYDRIFSTILLRFIVVECSFIVSCFPLLLCHSRVPGYYWFPSFAPLGTRAHVVPATLVTGPFLVSHSFLFWCFFPKSLLLTFRSRISLESWPLISLPSKLLNLTFSDSAFWLFFLLSFFSSKPISSLPG